MECPACGKVIVHDEEPADFIVCPFCFEGVALRNGDPHALGKMSSLSATPSPFRVGATGSIAGRGFSILGRVRYAWDGGYWDEWYVGLMDGTHAWISEDGGEYTFERWAELDQPPAGLGEAELGSALTIAGEVYQVRERGTARFEGAEGQLPFEVVEGETVPYLDLASEKSTATVEFDEDGTARIFRGRVLALSEVDMDFRGDPGDTPDALDRSGGGTRPIADAPSPGGVRHRPEDGKRRPKVPFEIGQAGKLDGQMVTIAGHIRFKEREEGVTYISDEFYLKSEDGKERWLLMERGHFSLSTPLKAGPSMVRYKTIRPKSSFSFAGQEWKAFERGSASIAWVEGELPWLARVGDTNRFMDAVSPPFMLSAEWTDDELEWFTARYLPRAEVAAAFQMPIGKLPPKRGIAPNQPRASKARSRAAWVMVAAAFVNFVLAIIGLADNGEYISAHDLAAMDYSEGFLTTEFEVTEAPALCLARFHAPVSNQWIYVDCALVDQEDKAVVEFSAQVSYYFGRQGGESWTEGSQDDESVFRVEQPGTYRLLIQGESGYGESAGPPGRGPPLRVEVRQNCGLARWHFLLAGLFGLAALIELCLVVWFESERWKHSDL